MSDNDLKIVSSVIDSESDFLNSISQNLWKNPELKFEEVYAHELLTNALEKYGFHVKKNYVLPTAFRAEYSTELGPVIAICLEYDALPEIGHACGHNLISEAGLAAGIAIKAAMDADQSIKGKIVLLGTPAEECGGGKIKLINGSAFENIDVAMMVHPMKVNWFDSVFLSRMIVVVDFKGKEAHASAFPWEGVNALDAAVILYQSLGLMRQQMKPTNRIHAIISKGGVAPNIIPSESRMVIHIRTSSTKELQEMVSKVENCTEGAAKSTGCSYSISIDKENLYENLLNNETMLELYTEFSDKLGSPPNDISSLGFLPVGSTDMGNVSHLIPSIHPFYGINSSGWNHTKEFAASSKLNEAQLPTLIAAKAMAMTVLSLLRFPEKIEQAKEQFIKQKFDNEHTV